MFIEVTTHDDISFLLNTEFIEQVSRNDSRGGSMIYIHNDEFNPYFIKEPYEYIRNILLYK